MAPMRFAYDARPFAPFECHPIGRTSTFDLPQNRFPYFCRRKVRPPVLRPPVLEFDVFHADEVAPLESVPFLAQGGAQCEAKDGSSQSL